MTKPRQKSLTFFAKNNSRHFSFDERGAPISPAYHRHPKHWNHSSKVDVINRKLYIYADLLVDLQAFTSFLIAS